MTLSLEEIRQLRLDVQRGKLPKADYVIELCERVEDDSKTKALQAKYDALVKLLEDAGYETPDEKEGQRP